MNYILINKDELFFRRNEDGNQNIILVKSKGSKLYLNKTGYEILEQILNSISYDDIVSSMVSKYSNTEKEIIVEDIKSVFRLLDIYNIIQITDSNDNLPEGFIVKAAGDKDYSRMYEFFKKGKYFSYPKDVNLEYFSPSAIRFRQVNNKEFYFICYKNSEIVGIISIIFPKELLNSLTISGVYLKHETDEEYIYSLIENLIKETIITNESKLRAVFVGKDGSVIDSNGLRLFTDLGFEFEAILKKELGDNDILLYNKIF